MPPSLHTRQSGAPHRTEAESQPVEAELVARAKRDPQAFASLYGLYLDPIHRHCYRRLGNREAAEDATSQVFTKAFAALPRFDERAGSFRGWLFTIAEHVLADHYRAAKQYQPLDGATEISDTSPSPEELAVTADAGLGLRAAVAQLPDQQRRVVELRLAGLTGPEIGRVLGCRAKTVDVAQFRAVAKLRALLGVVVTPKGGRDA